MLNVQQPINDVLKSMDAAGAGMIDVLAGTGGFGMKLLSIIFAMMFFYNVILFMLDNNQKIMVDITKLTMTFVILSAMLMGWSSPVGSMGPTSTTSVAKFFLVDINAVTEKFTGGEDVTPKIVTVHLDAIGNVWNIYKGDYLNAQVKVPVSPAQQAKIDAANAELIAYLTSKGVSNPNPNGNATSQLLAVRPQISFDNMIKFNKEIGDIQDKRNMSDGDKTVESMSNTLNISGLGTYLVDAISTSVGKILAFFAIIIAVIFIFMSLVTFIFLVNAGQIMLYVGLALGPMLIPFLLIDKLSFLFDGWLKLMISGALYKMVGALVALLAIGAINEAVKYGANAGTEDSIYFIALIVAFFAMLAKQLMEKADNIATALSSGGASSGSDGGNTFLMSGTKIMGRKPPKPPKGPKP